MTYQFRSAAQRHIRDAEHLHTEQRLANAGHLFGFACECALKAFLEREGVAFDQPGPWWQHVDELWEHFIAHMRTREGARWAAKLPQENPFTNWSISDRYRDSHNIVLTDLPLWESGAKKACRLLTEARLDGYLPS
ncbi:MAG: hypothetical protein ACLQVX_06760 [Limisphaerales bacterium]